MTPSTVEVLAAVAEGDKADIDRQSQQHTRGLQRSVRKMSPSDRGKLIWKLADLIEEECGRVCHREDAGQRSRPLTISKARGTVRSAIDCFRLHGGLGDRSIRGTATLNIRRAGQLLCVHAARSLSAWWTDHSVELPAAHGRVESCSRTRRGLLRSTEARRANTSIPRCRLGRTFRRSGIPGRRSQM